MTTIVYRSGVMAGDTAGSDEDCKAMECEKVRRLKGGWVVGFSGNMCYLDHVMEMISAGLGRSAPASQLLDMSEMICPEEDDHNEPEDVALLMAHKTHGVYRAEMTRSGMLMCWRLGEGYHALGCGMKVALGALHHGATAREAVEAAIEHDNQTGGHITEVEV